LTGKLQASKPFLHRRRYYFFRKSIATPIIAPTWPTQKINIHLIVSALASRISLMTLVMSPLVATVLIDAPTIDQSFFQKQKHNGQRRTNLAYPKNEHPFNRVGLNTSNFLAEIIFELRDVIFGGRNVFFSC